jgi:soluble lytic murein transglycosylase
MTVVVLSSCTEVEPEPSTRRLLELETVIPTPTLDPSLPTAAVSIVETEREGVGTPSPDQTLIEQSPTLEPPTPTNTQRPTPTLRPEEHIELGNELLHNEDYIKAVEEFQAVLNSEDLSDRQMEQSLFSLGWAAFEEGQSELAVDALSQLISRAVLIVDTAESDIEIAAGTDLALVGDAYYLLALNYEQRGQCRAAIRAYEAYLGINSDMRAYIQPKIASCHLTLDEQDAALEALARGADAEAVPSRKLELNEQLAQSLLNAGRYREAIDQYEELTGLTSNAEILGRAHYQIGWAHILLGELPAGYDRYLTAVEKYPKAYESYLALVDLIEAEVEVDDYYRGVVDYYAGSYEAAVFVLQRYVASGNIEHDDARLFLAWSLEALGMPEEALTQIDAYIGEQPVPTEEDVEVDTSGLEKGWIERAKLQVRSGNYEEAVASYLNYLQLFPQGDQAPFAAWWAASLTEQLGQIDEAILLYEALADEYAFHEDASEALYRAGYLNWLNGDSEESSRLWMRAASEHPGRQFGAASLVWLLKSGDSVISDDLVKMADANAGDTYYHLRAQDIVSSTQPYQAPAAIELASNSSEQLEAEDWLRVKTGLAPGTDIASLSEQLSTDGRLVRGEKLWRLGLREEAKRELESLRIENANDPIASYQLALYFRDLGLYRSSILAASSVLWNLGTHIFDAPPFIAKLVYPIYYSDLVLEQANQYGYDPLLQFALLRQESLFESFARSHAAAMGLSQVIPDTGNYIAARLDWPDFVLDDLYKPYVGIAFGAYYLDQQLDAFDGNTAAALSAYNGGPGNASRWMAADPEDIDEYLEIVDYNETREYIKRIYAGQAIYRHLYGDLEE